MKYFNSYKTSLLFLIAAFVFVDSAFAKEKVESNTDERNFVELSPSDIKPPFTQKTVLELNSIVRRSYDAINEFDKLFGQAQKNISKAASSDKQAAAGSTKKTQQTIEEIHSLEKASKTALNDIRTAATKLRSSDEEYNNAILEGMIQFVEDVEKEISQERKRLNQLLEST